MEINLEERKSGALNFFMELKIIIIYPIFAYRFKQI